MIALSRVTRTQPWKQLVEAELVALREGGEESVGLRSLRREASALDGEKRMGGGERRPRIAMDKG